MKRLAKRLIPMPPPLQHRRTYLMDMSGKVEMNAYYESVASYFRILNSRKGWNSNLIEKQLKQISHESQELDNLHNQPPTDIQGWHDYLEQLSQRPVGEESVRQFISQKQHDHEGKSFIVL